MSLHVGIDPMNGKVAAYNEKNKRTINFKINTKLSKESKIEDVEKMFKEIKTLTNGKVGFACITFLCIIGNEIRKSFIEKGKEFGFLDVQIINVNMYTYLEYISKIGQKPKNGDIIWIFRGYTLFKWKKLNSKAKMIKRIKFKDFEKFIKILQKKKFDTGNKINSHIFIYQKGCELDMTILKRLNTKSYFFGGIIYSEMALIKARIMAKDEEVLDYDVETQVEFDIEVKINEKKILSIKECELLPFEKRLTIGKCENVFKIFVNEQFIEEIKVTPLIGTSKPNKIVVKIDQNRIITIDYVQNNSLEKRPVIKEKNIQPPPFTNLQTKNKEEELTFLEKGLYDIPRKQLITKIDHNVVGIDLGTSRCCAAINGRNGIKIIALDNGGEQLLPSYVGFDEAHPKCGREVVRRMQHYAKSTVFDAKRIIGRNFEDVKIDESWPFEVIERKNKPLICIQGPNQNKIEKQPEEVSAVLLKNIKQKCEEIQGKELNEVVVTIPASFNEQQKAATYSAAKLSGWKIIHILTEPIAASIAYFADKSIPPNFVTLLFDLGGGTLDISIFKVDNNKLKIVTNHGDGYLGGRNFDQLLFNYFANILAHQFGIKIKTKDTLKYRLMQECMNIKHTLSIETKSGLDVVDFGHESYLRISRTDLEEMAKPLLDRIQALLIHTLAKTEFTALEINKVLLVGGGCRMPMIKLLLQKMFSKAEHSCDEHPYEIVAMGAAYYATIINSQNNTNCSVI